jgi:hypothetical protein
MTAADALARARAAGLSLTVSDDRIRWLGARPSEGLLAELRAHKPELLALLADNERRDLAAALLAGAAAVRAGLADDIEAAEGEAIRELAEVVAPEPPERHRELIRPFLMAALYRAPYWPDPEGHPVTPGAFCGACHGRAWWWGADPGAGRAIALGWHCARCYPPAEGNALRQMRSGLDGEPPGPHQRRAAR